MSKYTGKCDLYDSLISIFNMDENSDWSKVINKIKTQIFIKTENP